MRNSTVLTIILIIIVILTLWYLRKIEKNIKFVEGRVYSSNITNIPHLEYDDIDSIYPIDSVTTTPNIPNMMNNKQLPVHELGNNLLQYESNIQVADQNAQPRQIVLPLPQSGRFYDSGEFHVVGHISRQRLTQDANLPTTLPLYGQRIQSQRAAWNYLVIDDRKNKCPVMLPSDPNKAGCMSDIGCSELQSGDIVVVPLVSQKEKWTVKMYSRI